MKHSPSRNNKNEGELPLNKTILTQSGPENSVNTVKVTAANGFLNLPAYHEGELLHAYMHKSALANGFRTVDEFLKKIQELPKLHLREGFITGYDAMSDFQKGIRFDKDFDWLRSGTLYPVLNSFSSVPPAKRLGEYSRNVVFRGSEENVSNFINDLYVCPDCMKDEGDDWYYHTNHQIPYLTYCPKHGTRLLHYKGVKCHEADNPKFEEIKPFPQEKRLSAFSRAILESNIDCSVYGIIGAVNRKLVKLIKPCDIEPYYEDRVEMLGIIPFRGLENFVEYKTTLPVKQMIALIAYLYDTPYEFLSNVPKGADHRSEFMASIKGRFKMLTSYRNDAVKLQCMKCGDIFYAYPPAFIMNPVCRKEENGYE